MTLLALAIHACRPILPLAVLGVAGALLVISCFRSIGAEGPLSRSARALVGAVCLYPAISGAWTIWPAYLLVPLVVTLAIGFIAGFGRDLLATLRRGRLGRAEWLWIAVIAVLAATALIAWVVLFAPDLSRLRNMLPAWPLLGLVAAGAGFSIVNALLEEIVWRGVLQGWLLTWLPPWAAVGVQALSFGAAHYAGFPSGLVGMGLAATWGAMIGALALRSGGLAAPVVAHIAADAVIFAVLAGALVRT